MSRPRKDQEGPGAVERLEEAFWEALTEKPYAEITVGEIAQRAQVNKNTFYYHFDGMQTLAEQALDHMLPHEIACMFLIRGGIPEHPDESRVNDLANDRDLRERANKGMLVVGKHGSKELVALLKNLVMQTWFDLFEVDQACLSSEAMAVVKFALGGLLEVMEYESCREDDMNPIQTVLNSGIVGMASARVVEVLRAARDDAQARAEGL